MKLRQCLLLLGTQAVAGQQLKNLPAARAATTTSTALGSQRTSTTQPPRCGGQTINAPGADLVYWDPDVHTYALSEVQCSTIWGGGHIQGVSYYTVSQSTNFPFPPTSSTQFTAASTLATTIRDRLITGTYVMTTTVTNAGSVQTSVISSPFVNDADSTFYEITDVGAAITPTGQAPVSIKGGVPILLISQLEIESMSSAGGSCETQTSTAKLDSPLVLSLSGSTSWPGPGPASGSLPAAVISAFASNAGSFAAGTFDGLPTVVIVSQSIFPVLCNDVRPFQHLNSGSTVLPPQSLHVSPGSSPTSSPDSGSPDSSSPDSSSSPSDGASGSFGETGSGDRQGNDSNASGSRSGATLTYQGTTYTAAADGGFNISGNTLMPGYQVTLAGGTTLSLAPSGTAVVEQYDGTTSTLPVAFSKGTAEPSGSGLDSVSSLGGANGAFPTAGVKGSGGPAGAQNDDPLSTTSSGSNPAPTSNDAMGRRIAWTTACCFAVGLAFWTA